MEALSILEYYRFRKNVMSELAALRRVGKFWDKLNKAPQCTRTQATTIRRMLRTRSNDGARDAIGLLGTDVVQPFIDLHGATDRLAWRAALVISNA